MYNVYVDEHDSNIAVLEKWINGKWVALCYGSTSVIQALYDRLAH
jgi:hypothetical protein